MKKLLTLFLVFYSVSAEAQSITSYIQPDTLSVGDTFDFIITSTYTADNYTPVYPGDTAFDDPFETLSIQRFRGITSRDSIVYRMQFFGVRDTIIPPQPVHFVAGTDTATLYTVALPVIFRSNLAGESSELKPYKPIFGFAPPWLLWTLIALLILIALALLWRYRHKFFGKPEEDTTASSPVEIPPFISPLYTFEKTLRELRNTDDFKSDAYISLHIQLSNALRQYFEDVYNILALESTTREIVDTLNSKRVHESIVTQTQTILRRCDLIKFAKAEAQLHDVIILLDRTDKLKDLFRHFDEPRLKKMRSDYEIKHGLRDNGDHDK